MDRARVRANPSGCHRSGKPHNGIAYCPMGSRSLGEMIQGLFDIWDLLEPEEMAGQIEFP